MIYPKDYLLIQRNIRLNEAFVLMPFDAAYDWVFESIKYVCDKINIKAIRADNMFGSVPIIENILQKIHSSEIIIADLTGRNANVFYEVGIAHTLRDRNSIILLAQHLDDIPFDLRHLNVILYSPSNKSKFKEKLKNTIVTSRLNYSSDEYVKQLLSAYNYSSELIDSFISFLKKNYQSKYTLLVSVLRGDKEKIELYKEWFDDFSSFFVQIAEYCSGQYSKLVFTIWNNFLLTDYILSEHVDMISERLSINYHNPNGKQLKQYEVDMLYFTAVLCVHLCQKGHRYVDAMKWLFNYLTNRRMGRIDTIRSTIERFFVETDDKVIKKELVKNISNESPTVRENIADICGEKRLKESVDKLIAQLQFEESPYVVRSIVAALGKMSVAKAAPDIVRWMKEHPDKWGKSNCGSLESVALNAFAESGVDGEYVQQLKSIHSTDI